MQIEMKKIDEKLIPNLSIITPAINTMKVLGIEYTFEDVSGEFRDLTRLFIP